MSKKYNTEAFDRKIRPIYDALDSRNWKTALKLATAALEKYPNSDLIKALKAVALQRSGKAAEAGKLCDEVVANAPTDEHILHPLVIVLKDLQRAHDITKIHELACNADPKNYELLRGLFGCYVRENNFAKQQQVAMKLHKQVGGEQYLWWIVLSIMLQARAALTGQAASIMAPNKLVQLAESLVSRHLSKEHKLDNYEALLVYADLLLAQGKQQEALQLVEGPVGDVISMPAERTHLKAVLSMMTGQLQPAAAMLASHLQQDPDDWSSLQLYLDAVMPGTAGSASQPDSSLLFISGGLASILCPPAPQPQHQSTPVQEETASFVSSLREASATATASSLSKQFSVRGPDLAQVELAHRAVLSGSSTKHDLAKAVLAYVDLHSHLVSCAVDVRCYTKVLEGEAAAWLADELTALRSAAKKSMEQLLCFGDAAAEDAAVRADANREATRHLRRMVCMQQVLDDLGLPQLVTCAAAVEHAVSLMQEFVASQALYAGLDERERGPADELPVLAASALMTAVALAPTDMEAVPHLLQAVLLLEATTANRPYSAAMRLALAAMYTLLGCPATANSHVRALDIKNIQMDTLASHHLLPGLAAFQACPLLTRALGEVLQLFHDHDRDAGDSIFMAYKHGTYTKVLEFVAFKERLHCAHSMAVARAEQSISNILEAAKQSPEAAAAAVHAACTAMPTSELPGLLQSTSQDNTSTSTSTSTSGNDSSSSSSSSCLRFNEDLSTRPAWYPPSPASCHLSPAEWWDSRKQHHGQGYGRRWWAATSSAESNSPAAMAVREAKHAALQRRWLVPHLLAHTLQDSAATVPFSEAIHQFSSCLGIRPGQVDTCLQQVAAGDVETPLWQQPDYLLLATFAAAECISQCLIPDGTAARAAPAARNGAQQDAASTAPAAKEKIVQTVELACQRLARLQLLIRAISTQLSRTMTTALGGLVLPAGALNVAYALVLDALVVLRLALECWSRSIGQLCRTKAKQPPTQQLHVKLSCPLTEVRDAVVAALQAFADVLGSHPTAPRDAAACKTLTALGSMPTGVDNPAHSLWGWHKGLDASKAVLKIMEEQASIVAQLVGAALKQAKSLSLLSVEVK